MSDSYLLLVNKRRAIWAGIAAKGFKKNMRIVFDKYLKQWNYRAIPAKLADVVV